MGDLDTLQDQSELVQDALPSAVQDHTAMFVALPGIHIHTTVQAKIPHNITRYVLFDITEHHATGNNMIIWGNKMPMLIC